MWCKTISASSKASGINYIINEAQGWVLKLFLCRWSKRQWMRSFTKITRFWVEGLWEARETRGSRTEGWRGAGRGSGVVEDTGIGGVYFGARIF